MTSVVSDLLGGVDDILGLRDDIGAALKEVHLVTRSWRGSEPGDGTYVESKVRMLPSPRVVEFTDSHKIREGGAVQQGDIMLKMISKNLYPKAADLDCSSGDAAVERFYEVGGSLYRVVTVTEKHVTWNVLLRKLTAQRGNS